MALGHTLGPHVHEHRVIQRTDLLHLIVAHLARHRNGEGFILSIEHQGLLHHKPIVSQHLLKAIDHWTRSDPLSQWIEHDAHIARGHDHRPTTHQVLIHGVAGLVVEAIRAYEDQHIDIRWHPPGRQIHHAHLILLLQRLTDLLPG